MSSKFIPILAAALVLEASVFSSMLLIDSVATTAQLFDFNHSSQGTVCYDDKGERVECEDDEGGNSSDGWRNNDDQDDDGNAVFGGYCGDGAVGPKEECDDGVYNGSSGSSCSVCCILKPVGQERYSECFCGNGRIEWPEQCDKGGRNGKSHSSCNAFCKVIDLCGNGYRDNGEECDDGNADNLDGCTNDCMKPKCGDGLVQPAHGEECDDENANNNDGCSKDCKEEFCGDGIEQNNEECDKGSENSDDGECTTTCTKARCGDGIVQKDEECDGDVDCTEECTFMKKDPVAVCGNGITEGPEECDDGNADHGDACTNHCTIAKCGDGILQPSHNEECDEGIDNGKVILDKVHCTEQCTYPAPQIEKPKEPTPIQPKTDDKPQDKKPDDILLPAAPDVEKMEEMRRKKEEQEKLLIEAMRKKREEAEQQKQQEPAQEETVEKPQPEKQDTEPEKQEEPQGLHCFDAEGNVVSDRTQCDSNQEKFLQNPDSIPEEVIQEELRKKLLGDDVSERMRMNLVDTMSRARTRLERVSQARNFDAQTQQYFVDAIAWLDRGVSYFSSAPRDINEIQQMAEPVRQLVDQASALMQQKHHLPATRPDIEPIVEKIAKLLMKFRESFIALAQGGIELDQQALQTYTEAANLFENVKTLCQQDRQQCGHFKGILDMLKDVQEPLQRELEKNPEIFQKIQAKFEQ